METLSIFSRQFDSEPPTRQLTGWSATLTYYNRVISEFPVTRLESAQPPPRDVQVISFVVDVRHQGD
jgi:hypothetical protein